MKKTLPPKKQVLLKKETIAVAGSSKKNTPAIAVTNQVFVSANANLGNAFDALLLAQYVPASVIINYDLEILQFKGQTAPYLQNSSGKASFNILKMAHLEITFELRNIIHQAIKTKQIVRKTGIEMNRDVAKSLAQIVNIEVAPLKVKGEEPLLIVVFTGYQVELPDNQVGGIKNNSLAKDRRIKKLEEEIAAARVDMSLITHDQEAVSEVKRLAIELQIKENKVLEVQLEAEKKAMKIVEDSNKRYNMLLMQSPFAFAIMKGKEMVVTLANDSIKEMWGKGNDVEGKTFLEILPELTDSQFPALLQKVYTTGVPFQDYEMLVRLNRNKKFEDVYFNFVYQPYYESDATISGVVIIASEVTTHVIIKKQLIEAKNDAELKTQIAENAVKAKQQFLSNMSHEIRTPMNAIVGFTNVILKTDLDQNQQAYINAIKVSGDALVILINDILDLAKVDSGKMTFEQTPFSLSASIDSMIQLFEIKIKEKNLEFSKIYDEAIPRILVGDPMRLRQIILNLVSNAVKFTAEGKITMSVKLLNENIEKTSIEFTITDTGIGIPENKLKVIFNDFEQASNETSSSYGGTGLGLAIVKQLVELQGGEVSVKSELGKGAVFSFILRFENPTHEQTEVEAEAEKEENEIRNLKILVAEDMVLNQLLIKIILADFDFEVDIAENGKIALEKLTVAERSRGTLGNHTSVGERSRTYDIILMDLQMPEMDGFETTAYIRNELKSDIPIIALTADVTTVDIEKCLAAGMNDYISKPIDEKLLYSKIIKALKAVE